LEVSAQKVGANGNLTEALQRDLNGVTNYETHQGLFNTPLNMDQYKRSSPRDFLVNTAQYLSTQNPVRGKIDIRTNCLATKVLFAPNSKRAIGVSFLDGQSLYRADARAGATAAGVPGM
jgi:choline dehydrogenase